MGWGWQHGPGWGRRWGWQQPVPPPQPFVAPDKFRAAVACMGSGGLEDMVSPQFARAPSFAIVMVEGDRIVGIDVVNNPYQIGGGGVGPMVAEMLAQRGVSVVIAGSIGPNAMAVLAQRGIAAFPAPPGSRVIDAVEVAARRKLKGD